MAKATKADQQKPGKKKIVRLWLALREKTFAICSRGASHTFGRPMGQSAGERQIRASNCLQQAKEAMEMAEQAKSLELREQLLLLAINWLKLAHEVEQTRDYADSSLS